jgi:hypothetical protein
MVKGKDSDTSVSVGVETSRVTGRDLKGIADDCVVRNTDGLWQPGCACVKRIGLQ